jgi:hypothetical protein
MAKKADSSSTAWIWLRGALALAVATLGSEALAKARLRKWMIAGDLPWTCVDFNALSAEQIAELERERQKPVRIRVERRGHLLEPDRVIVAGNITQTPTTAYFKGDGRFWADAKLEIDWVDNSAREVITDGARALGIRVSRKHLLELLPPRQKRKRKSHESVAPAVSPEPVAPAVSPPEQSEPQAVGGATVVWITDEARRMKDAGKIPIRITDFARELERRMKKAAEKNQSLRPVGWRHIKNMLPRWVLWPISCIN